MVMGPKPILGPISSPKPILSSISYHVRSFNANSDEYICIIHNEDDYPGIMIFTENWLTENTTVNILGFEAFMLFLREVVVVVAFQSSLGMLVSSKIENLCKSDETIEICAMSIIFDAYNFTIYRPHSEIVGNFSNQLSMILEDSQVSNKKCIILGGFNIILFSSTVDVCGFMNNLRSYN